ncbi:MAG: TetR/AcrR family transcriptional regulator [Thiohalospira sp.]
MSPEQQNASQQEILATAARLFSRHGFEGVSLSAIASAAGTSKANVLYHFTSKDQLYIQVMETCCSQVLGSLESELGGDGPIEERIRAFAASHLEHLLEKPELNRLIMRELQHGDGDRGRELAQGVLRQHFNGIVEHIRSAQGDGVIRADIDPAILVLTLFGGNQFFFAHRDHLRTNENCRNFIEDPEHFTRQLVDILFNGVALNPAQTSEE